MINFTREEVTDVLKAFSRIEGFLYAIKETDTMIIQSELEYPSSLLSKKLIEEKK